MRFALLLGRRNFLDAVFPFLWRVCGMLEIQGIPATIANEATIRSSLQRLALLVGTRIFGSKTLQTEFTEHMTRALGLAEELANGVAHGHCRLLANLTKLEPESDA